jgi:cytochrome P450
MLRDKRVFKDPELYLPERWLSEDASTLPDPTNIAFGFGTRYV